MKAPTSEKDGRLLRRFYLTELFANTVGAPLAAAYGAFMIDFSRVPVGDFLLSVGVIIVANQLLLAIPINSYLSRKARSGLADWRAGRLGGAGLNGFLAFVSRLPLLQAGLIFARMVIATGAALLMIIGKFDSAPHAAATFLFAIYSGFITGLVIYYYLQSVTSGVAEEIVAGLPPNSPAFAEAGGRKLESIQDSLPLLVPTLISSLGIFCLMMAIRRGSGDIDFYAFRTVAALVLNILTICPILIFSRRFHKRRLKAIGIALEEMVVGGDTSRSIPTDLGDEFALTAHRINKAFDLFRLVLSQMASTSERLSGTVMSFSSQLRETVSATTTQASAVKEIVGTMESSNQINKQIEDRAKALSGNARESRSLVDEGFGKVQGTILKIDEIKQANAQTLNEIGELSEEISAIGEIIEIINKIANQTRVIAFNAELEASSAGAAGVSFRIVAEEIRRLANSTVDSLVGIKGQVSQIQKGSDRLQASSEEGTVKIEEGMRLSGDLNDIFTRIRDSAESTFDSAGEISRILVEQNQAFDQIFVTLKQISEGAEQVLSSAKMSGAEVNKLQGLIEELKRLLARFGYERAKGGEMGEQGL